MGEIVDLDAFRKQRKEEEEASALAEAESIAAAEEAEIQEMKEILDRIMFNLGEVITGSHDSYRSGLSMDDLYDHSEYTIYTHEAGYNDDGYYEKTWQIDPFSEEDDETDF